MPAENPISSAPIADGGESISGIVPLILSRLRRTLMPIFGIGRSPDSVNLRANAQNLVVRNNDNSANSGIEAATIQLTSNAYQEYVLTSDENGLGSWKPSSAFHINYFPLAITVPQYTQAFFCGSVSGIGEITINGEWCVIED